MEHQNVDSAFLIHLERRWCPCGINDHTSALPDFKKLQFLTPGPRLGQKKRLAYPGIQ